MIKLIAALTMLIDHIGVVLYPSEPVFRIIGRLSMPLYAYCVARGFYFSKQHGTLHKYLRNMLIFATVSQMPYWWMIRSGFNIGYTWMISLLLLMVGTLKYKSNGLRIATYVVCGLAVTVIVGTGFFPVDYGIYGIITPLFFYFLIATGRENIFYYILALAIGNIYYILIQNGSLLQIISIYSAFILTVRKKIDKKIELPKWVFYAFYPVHILMLLGIDYLVG